MQVFQRAPDPVIVVEVMRRPQAALPTSSSTNTSSVFPTPLVGGGGGLCSSTSGVQNGTGDNNSEMSSILSTRRGLNNASRSVAVQTLLSAGEMAASLAIAAASFAQQEARMALLGEPTTYCMWVDFFIYSTIWYRAVATPRHARKEALAHPVERNAVIYR